jgi:metal-responsive CopG/Arc/MetJ family transcriptional regulator
MPVRPVQISIDSALLDQIDADSESREKGRSAFITSAVQFYLRAKERQNFEARLVRAYQGQACSLLDEMQELMWRQAWPAL